MRGKKRIAALVLGVLTAVNLLPVATASAAAKPTPQSKTITLTQNEISLGEEVKDRNVKVEVTYTGWLGEIDAAQNGVERGAINGKIAVLKEGSEIRFKITSTDPAAYYNFCYEKTRFDDEYNPYGWDDSGSGWYYYNTDMMNLMVYGQGDGTSKFAAGPLFRPELEEFGRKINSNTYAYQAVNGLVEYHFTAKYAPENNTYIPQGGVAEYLLGTALTINDEQIKELEQTGTMTFLKGVSDYGSSLEYQRTYEGLAELLGISAPKELQFKVTNYQGLYDAGHVYEYTITNNSDKPVEGYYGLFSYGLKEYYYPKKDFYSWPYDFHTFKLKLAPKESVSGTIITTTFVSNYNSIWIHFENEQELVDFIPDKTYFDRNLLYTESSVGLFDKDWAMKTFGVDIPVVKVSK